MTERPPTEKPPSSSEPSLEAFEIVAAGESAAGERKGKPSVNEDRYFSDAEHGNFGLFDGMGGYGGGAEAAEIASQIFEERLKQMNAPSPEEMGEKTQRLFQYADDEVQMKAKSDPKLAEMGTTALVMKLWKRPEDGKPFLIIGNMGDSRLYRFRPDGTLEQATLDHSSMRHDLQDDAKAWEMQRKLATVKDPSKLPPAEKAYYDIRNIISAAVGRGGRALKPDIYIREVQESEKWLMLGDGIHDYLTDQEIAEVVAAAPGPKEAVHNLIAAARAVYQEKRPRTKSYLDDATAVLVNFGAW